MDRIAVNNYRCFGPGQAARLAPLTLLVGPNSTGKTSFLALIGTMLDVVMSEEIPNFRKAPFDLGGFEDIVHDDGSGDSLGKFFEAEIDFRSRSTGDEPVKFGVRFENRAATPFPVKRSIVWERTALEVTSDSFGRTALQFTGPSGQLYRRSFTDWPTLDEDDWIPSSTLMRRLQFGFMRGLETEQTNQDAAQEMRTFARGIAVHLPGLSPRRRRDQYFSGGAVRSKPVRTYDPMRLAQDAEGEYIPSFLASMARRDSDRWQTLKIRLEDFGRKSALFDEISVRSFGDSDGDPFQIQVLQSGELGNGKPRNLIDVGYGVSQALPLLTELLRPDRATTFLLQQPEVHLHPQAQAALGSLFCSLAADGLQLVIETHSDYIIDRVRTDIRDGTAGLKPEDVSIIYFEPNDLGVKIHSIRLDEMGNVLDAPPDYRRFFMEEVRRSIGL